jgi:hypothetical protein
VSTSWWVIIVSAIIIPSILSVLWLASMKRFTKTVIFLALALLLTAGILLTVFLYIQSGSVQYEWVAKYNLDRYEFLNNSTTLYLAYLSTAVMLLILFILIALRKSIIQSIHVLKLGSKALRKLPMTLAFPLNIVILVTSLFLWTAFVAASLASAGETVVVDVREELERARANFNSTIIDRLLNATNEWNGTLTYYAGNTTLNWLQLYNLFMFLWTSAFAHGFTIMVVASAVSMWYFSKNKSKQPDLTVHKMPKYYILNSIGRTLLFHTGTIALGSLLIAIVSSIRWFVTWLQKQLLLKNESPTYIPANMRLAVDCIIQCLLRCL